MRGQGGGPATSADITPLSYLPPNSPLVLKRGVKNSNAYSAQGLLSKMSKLPRVRRKATQGMSKWTLNLR